MSLEKKNIEGLDESKDNKQYIIISIGNTTRSIEKDIINLSKVLSASLTNDTKINLENISIEDFETILEFMRLFHKNPKEKIGKNFSIFHDTNDWRSKWIQIKETKKKVDTLLKYSHYYDIPSLFNLCISYIAYTIKEKSIDELTKLV